MYGRLSRTPLPLAATLLAVALALGATRTASAESYRLLVSTAQGQLRSVVLEQDGQGENLAKALDDARARALDKARELLSHQIEDRKLDIKLSFLGADDKNGAASFVFLRGFERQPQDPSRPTLTLVKAVAEVVYLLTPGKPPSPSTMETLPPVPALPLTPPYAGNSTINPSAIRQNQKLQYQQLELDLQQKLQQMILDAP